MRVRTTWPLSETENLTVFLLIVNASLGTSIFQKKSIFLRENELILISLVK